MEALGFLSAEVIKKLKEKKLLVVDRGGEIWVDKEDKAAALTLIEETETETTTDGKKKEVKARKKKFNLCGFEVTLPIQIDTSYHGFATNDERPPVGKTTKIYIKYHSKPQSGLDPDQNLKKISKVKIKGNEIELNAAALAPAYSGIVICDDEGIPIFEIMPFNIFVLFDTKAKPEATKRIFEELMLFALALSNHREKQSVEIYNKIREDQSPQREELQIIEFEKICTSGIRSELKTVEQNVKQHETDQKTYEKKLFTATRSLMEMSLRHDALKAILDNGMRDKAREEWQKLNDLEKNGMIRSVSVTSENFTFRTRMIYFEPDKDPFELAQIGTGGSREKVIRITGKQKIELGEYEVAVSLGRTFSVNVKNLTKQLSYDSCRWHHPHIKEGQLCQGNMADAIPKFAAQRNFEAIAMCMLKWLTNVDFRDAWGKRVWKWVEDHRKKYPDTADKIKVISLKESKLNEGDLYE